ncbi:hypothetical protein BU26DRAFT_148624 [Trematosphaeria pertusa]|uniref:CENP-V/GFA domain-containing protein n=1 Tax=Trematosphaeria pertusa TaxID=390896 RepID=A0A6A6IX73_9PLEO|nr:uncharacterized protein BU26DRAFT_148624 [Trematosphaeria pertusa]KAF2254966.1 hypothetical protein BU26DRAFT_148624 [Trematosphaeria pertusa]
MASAPPDFEALTGHCTCKSITYTLLAPPLVTHCCHCSWCQRETGTAFALNTVIECYNFRITSPTQPTVARNPSLSGIGQLVARCPTCCVAIYSHYSNVTATMFVRAGTLEEGSRQRVRPDVHIFTGAKVEWVDLSKEKERGVKVYEEYYEREDVWSEESMERRKKLLEWVEEQKGAV